MENNKHPPKENRRGFFSLRAKLIVGFSLIAAFASLIVSIASYTNSQRQITEGFRQRVLTATAIIALQQNGDEFEKITSASDPLYEKVRLQNLKILRSDPDFVFVYTMRQDAEGIYFVVDGNEPDAEGFSNYGDRYLEPSTFLVENFDSMSSTIVEPEIYTDEYGSFLSAYAPILTSDGRKVGVIGLDIGADTIAQEQKRVFTQSILIFLAALMTGPIFGSLAGNALARPVKRLAESALAYTAGRFDQKSDVNSRDEIGDLATSFNRMSSQLQDTLAGLEQTVNVRTLDLKTAVRKSEQYAQELQSISEISRTISTEQRLDILLPLITRLVSERFDFYHVGIFFVDEARRFAHLQAANSEGGQRMLARSHRLEIGTGLVGTVARTAKPRIALDVGADAAFFDNPDLPNTRSEMALPLNVRGQTIGVLDIQSTSPGAFTEKDANTLGILADQVAIAVENARLFGQMQQAREEAETLYAQIQRQEWSAFASQETRLGYRQTATGGRRLVKPIETNEIRHALENGQVVVLDGRESSAHPSIAMPVKLRGHTIGVLNIKAPTKDRTWNQDEINLAQAVSDRLALALDNARLLQESQRRAAKEAKIGEVSARISASINMRNVLQTAVEELGRALPGSEVLIQFEQPQ